MFLSMEPYTVSQAGWVLPLIKAGCQYSHGDGPFGRVIHIIRKDGEAVQVVQDKHRAISTSLGQLTATQKTIVDLLVATGVASEKINKLSYS